MSKILQYELWQECNNRCTYCTLGRENFYTPERLKIAAINKAIQDIKKLNKGEVSTLGFIGGEFFQGQLFHPEVKQAFVELIDTSNELLNKGIINELWINATLTIGDQADFFETLNKIDKKDCLWVLTSWDNLGRFHTPKMFEAWQNNLYRIHREYPEVRINITTIITKVFIDDYLSGDFNIADFEQQYHAKLFLKTPVKPDDLSHRTKYEINDHLRYWFFPREKDFMMFLVTFLEREGESAYDNLFSNDLKAEELHKNFNIDELRDVVFIRNSDFEEKLYCDKSLKNIEQSPCGHSNIYKCFADTDSCAVCLKQFVKNF